MHHPIKNHRKDKNNCINYGISLSMSTRVNKNPQQVWEKPPVNWLKMNIDASMSDNFTNAGFCIILRDHTGKFMGAMGYSSIDRDILQAEMMVLLKALRWIQEQCLSNVIIEGDNQEVVNSCNGIISSKQWENVLLVEECQSVLKSLNNCVVQFRKRICNQVADKLAKFARSSLRFQVWWDVPPNLLCNVLEKDSVKSSKSV